MKQPRNTYQPGEVTPTMLATIGRPVTFFAPGNVIEAGTVAKVDPQEDGTIHYDIRVISGGTYRGTRLGSLNNPQPNTFVFAP